MSIGVPIKLLHEAEGHIVTVETTTGEVYRGKYLAGNTIRWFCIYYFHNFVYSSKKSQFTAVIFHDLFSKIWLLIKQNHAILPKHTLFNVHDTYSFVYIRLLRTFV